MVHYIVCHYDLEGNLVSKYAHFTLEAAEEDYNITSKYDAEDFSEIRLISYNFDTQTETTIKSRKP